MPSQCTHHSPCPCRDGKGGDGFGKSEEGGGGQQSCHTDDRGEDVTKCSALGGAHDLRGWIMCKEGVGDGKREFPPVKSMHAT